MSIDEVMTFWLGDVDDRGISPPEAQKKWWTKDPDFDALVRERFGALHQAVVAGEHESWRDSPRGAAAMVIVLDQFSRNMYRDDPRMYANDIRAMEVAAEAIERGHDSEIGLHARFFLYMPFMHCEQVEAQKRCIGLMEMMAKLDECFADNVKYAIAHHDIVARFGRFPHRNDILERESTHEEKEFLEQPGSSF